MIQGAPGWSLKAVNDPNTSIVWYDLFDTKMKHSPSSSIPSQKKAWRQFGSLTMAPFTDFKEPQPKQKRARFCVKTSHFEAPTQNLWREFTIIARG
jgi:hypothetical protein